ncbi:MAG: hypothetical protein F2786_05195 [Actinobacteria bacterium]|uniref:Unannotated protein n=1 Tax=freshwater metagenome TaxID=449393 RepID=A0A6J7DT39_9ZZZZ|nr:hypothetical protein [Actinomycetota bacterium]
MLKNSPVEIDQKASSLSLRSGNIGLEFIKSHNGWYLSEVKTLIGDNWRTALLGTDGKEFSSGLGCVNAETLSWIEESHGRIVICLEGETKDWEAKSTIEMFPKESEIQRTQIYRPKKELTTRFGSGFEVATSEKVSYTYPLRVFGKALPIQPTNVTSDVSWALPLPFHLLAFDKFVVGYGIDRSQSEGTLTLVSTDKNFRIGVQMPDRTEQPQDLAPTVTEPHLVRVGEPDDDVFAARSSIKLTEVIRFGELTLGDPFLRALEVMAPVAFKSAQMPAGPVEVADGIVNFFKDGQLWDENALAPGKGWYRNMWVRITGDKPSSLSDGAGCFDFGWGEGIATETIVAVLRHWRRTGSTDLHSHIDEISRNIHLFRRGSKSPASYFDRFKGDKFCDFMLQDWVWTHCLAHNGLELLDAYLENPNYPDPAVRKIWLDTAQEIAAYLALHQRSNGDFPDIFMEQEREYDLSTSRIIARASVCGLFVKLHQEHVPGSEDYLERAKSLAKHLAPEIQDYEFNNNMLDVVGSPIAIPDGESAAYVLEGLVPLFEATGDPEILRLCEAATAVASWWTYTYDLTTAYRGRTRGGQTCRMPDYPLAFAGGTAKHVKPFLDLYRLTNREIYRTMAREMTAFICACRIHQPEKPWNGGLVHAFDQHAGYLWGPEREGQVDSGMTTGKGLAAIEIWLEAQSQ